jgi:hypothetical protein
MGKFFFGILLIFIGTFTGGGLLYVQSLPAEQIAAISSTATAQAPTATATVTNAPVVVVAPTATAEAQPTEAAQVAPIVPTFTTVPTLAPTLAPTQTLPVLDPVQVANVQKQQVTNAANALEARLLDAQNEARRLEIEAQRLPAVWVMAASFAVMAAALVWIALTKTEARDPIMAVYSIRLSRVALLESLSFRAVQGQFSQAEWDTVRTYLLAKGWAYMLPNRSIVLNGVGMKAIRNHLPTGRSTSPNSVSPAENTPVQGGGVVAKSGEGEFTTCSACGNISISIGDNCAVCGEAKA